MSQPLRRSLCTAYEHGTKSATALEGQNFTRQQADQIITTIERHAASRKDLVEAVSSLKQVMQEIGAESQQQLQKVAAESQQQLQKVAAESKQHVNTVARYTLAAAASGVAVLEYFDLKLVFQKQKRHTES